MYSPLPGRRLAGAGGAPFATDDPVPTDFQHWEIYLGTQYEHDQGGAAGVLAHLEVNYGVAPNLQLHLITPVVFTAVEGSSRQLGYGDTEVGAKYRFMAETAERPQIAVYPAVELPTGDRGRGLGAGHTQVFLPVWLQKSFGPWTTYGGGGYWLNPGEGNRNGWFTGWLLQRQLRPDLALGAEVFHEIARTIGGQSDTKVNVGIILDLDKVRHVLVSAGPTIQGPPGYQAFVAIQFTPAFDQ
jgi:hypothetical protein